MFETFQLEPLNFNQNFLYIRQKSKCWLFNLVDFLTICRVKSKGASILENIAILENFHDPALRRHYPLWKVRGWSHEHLFYQGVDQETAKKVFNYIANFLSTVVPEIVPKLTIDVLVELAKGSWKSYSSLSQNQ